MSVSMCLWVHVSVLLCLRVHVTRQCVHVSDYIHLSTSLCVLRPYKDTLE
jgi:hypothetical protein